ncbi:MAG: aminotransferase class V-fold PLP-dependent enzyme, partial [Gemmatimonadetes bacterium]|nr:aminotransferase class V-fold PLP-dependent enzyme [Gemmatimonadota bacterium]
MTPVAATPGLRDVVRELRDREFPWTAATTYLNNASIGPIPERTRLALEAFNAKRTAPHLLPDRDLMAHLADARKAAARMIIATPEEIALTANTSYGVNVAAGALPLAAGETILLSDREFPANVYPWLALRKRGIEVELAPVTADGFPDEDYLVERLADPGVRVLAVSFVQFHNGFKADLGRLSAACRAHGAYLVVDAIQGLGNSPLDVRETPVDVLACGGQKWLLSPWGSGFCYVRRDLIASLEPATVGWMAFAGTEDFTNLVNYTDRLRDDARRFEVHTVAFQDQLGMATSIGLLMELGLEAIGGYVRSLAE